MNSSNTTVNKINQFFRHSTTLKLGTITIMMLLLIIPTSMIESIISERQSLSVTAIDEVSAKWANEQQLNGPILSIPLLYERATEKQTTTSIKYWHILPNELTIGGEVVPNTLRRGVYEVVVYKSNLQVSGNFKLPEAPKGQYLKAVQYDKAFLTIGTSDLRGIKNNVTVNWGGKRCPVIPGTRVKGLISTGITVTVPMAQLTAEKSIKFNFSLDLRGSKSLAFTPLGSTTKVHVSSTWKSPSFKGSFLPDTREVSKEGFNASWSVLQLNRNFAQSWIGNERDMKEQITTSNFGVDLILEMDDYKKSLRTIKYAIMTIALTFLTFFLVEILNHRKIHPFQYALVGLAICLFYTLLVSISELLDFNGAYALSAAAIVSMISLYSINIFKSKKLTLLLSGILSAIYCFLFVTLQLTDYALLLGSLGLTVILAISMYFTRNVDWYTIGVKREE